MAPDGYQVNKPESEFAFLRPPSSTDERVIIPLIGTTEFIPDEFCTMPEELKKLDIDPNLWSNWATSMKERAAKLQEYEIGPIWICLFMSLIGMPCFCYMEGHNSDLLENIRKEGLIELNKNVLSSEKVNDAKLQQVVHTIQHGQGSLRKIVQWFAISLTDSDASILNQANWKYIYNRDNGLLQEIPEGLICEEGVCMVFCFEIPCGLYYY